MSKALDHIAHLLHERADQNGDGKVDRKDVQLALSQARARAEAETVKRPMRGLVIAAVCGALLMLGVVKGCSPARAAPARVAPPAVPAAAPEGFVDVEVYCVRKVCMVPVEILVGNAATIEHLRGEASSLQHRVKRLEARRCGVEG